LDEEFIKESCKFTKIDIYLSLLLFCIAYIITHFAFYWRNTIALLLTEIPLPFLGFIVSTIPTAVIIGIVFLVCKLRGHKFLTAGFNIKNTKKSLFIGFFIGISYVLYIYNLYSAAVDINFVTIVYIIFFILSAFSEQILFRSYIGARFYGYFKSKWKAVFLACVAVALLHIPNEMNASNISFLQAFVNRLFWDDTVAHIALFWLYAKYNDIFGPILLHVMINLAAVIFIIA